jgi:hypothetical protein
MTRAAMTRAAMTRAAMTRAAMTRAALLLLALGLTVTTPAASDETARTPVESLLYGIDFLPTAQELAQAGGDPATVAAIATNDGADPGVRLRAFRTLGQFDSPTAKASLTQSLTTLRDSLVPVDRLYVIAAAEALGEHGGVAAVDDLAALLAHESRDVRAAAATALGRTGAREACTALSAQVGSEDEPQVRAAINAALTDLGPQCQVGR